MNPKLQRLISSYKFHFAENINFSISKVGNGKWAVARDGAMWECPFNLMDGTKGGGYFNPFEVAEMELLRVCLYYSKELTRKEILHWFQLEWIRKEEEPELFLQFRQALLKRDYRRAATIYNTKFSSWERESIPDKVHYQVCINIPKT